MQSYIRRVQECLAVTWQIHFWQNDRDHLHATALTYATAVERIAQYVIRKEGASVKYVKNIQNVWPCLSELIFVTVLFMLSRSAIFTNISLMNPQDSL